MGAADGLKYTSKLTSNLFDRGRTKSPMCDHLPTDDANLGHRREREVVREGNHHVARVLREALDAAQERDRARHRRRREHAHDADHRRAAVEDLALEAALLLLGLCYVTVSHARGNAEKKDAALMRCASS